MKRKPGRSREVPLRGATAVVFACMAMDVDELAVVPIGTRDQLLQR